MTWLTLLLAPLYPDPGRLGDRDFHTRVETHRRLSDLGGALVAWASVPPNPEAAWRRARIVGEATRDCTAPWYEAEALIRVLAADPRAILADPRHFCDMLDRSPWPPFSTALNYGSYHWAGIVTSEADYTLERDLVRVAEMAVRNWRDSRDK